MFATSMAVRWHRYREPGLFFLRFAHKDPQPHLQVGDERCTADGKDLRGVGPHGRIDQEGMKGISCSGARILRSLSDRFVSKAYERSLQTA
jgi:hypothetical protein